MTDREKNSWLHCEHCGRTGSAIWRIEAGPRQRRRLESVTRAFTCVDGETRAPAFKCATCNKAASLYERPFRTGIIPAAQTVSTFSRALAMNAPTSAKA